MDMRQLVHTPFIAEAACGFWSPDALYAGEVCMRGPARRNCGQLATCRHACFERALAAPAPGTSRRDGAKL
jgi:hypothetical protein